MRRGQDRIGRPFPAGAWVGRSRRFSPCALIALIGFFGFTVRVNPEELGVVLRFGKFVRLLPPGINFRWPYPIEEVELPKVTRVNRIELGMRGSAENRETAGAVRDVPEESLMLTGDENIVDVDFVVFWRISDAPKYLFNIQDPEMTVKDVAESAMREIVGQSDIEPILTEARAKTEADGAGADAEDARQLWRRRPGDPGAAAEGRSAGASHRRLPRRAGRARRPGAPAERGAKPTPTASSRKPRARPSASCRPRKAIATR